MPLLLETPGDTVHGYLGRNRWKRVSILGGFFDHRGGHPLTIETPWKMAISPANDGGFMGFHEISWEKMIAKLVNITLIIIMMVF